jgi:hypothetical protein
VNGANEHPCHTDLLATPVPRVMVGGTAMGAQPYVADSTRSGADLAETKFLQLQSG